jgi:hypothetical protein
MVGSESCDMRVVGPQLGPGKVRCSLSSSGSSSSSSSSSSIVKTCMKSIFTFSSGGNFLSSGLAFLIQGLED